ncbi:MAG: carboxypeptidase regulatory-like domain-containing protein [bacterium]
MRQSVSLRTPWLVALSLVAALAFGCSNPDGGDSVVPQPGDPGAGAGQGTNIDFTPFEDLRTENTGIVDLEFESDGDVVVYDSTGWKQYTPGGVFKRSLNGGTATGLANHDSARGMCFLDADGSCNSGSVFDDPLVQGGANCVPANAAWYAGTADPFRIGCSQLSISGQWACSAVAGPDLYTYHPESGRPWWRVRIRQWTADNDPDGGQVPCNLLLPNISLNPPWEGILVYDPQAPFLDGQFNGPDQSDLAPPADFVFYTDKPNKDAMDGLAMQFVEAVFWTGAIRVIAWDGLPPTPFTSGMSSRSGVVSANIGDGTFDLQSRMIMAIPNSNSIAISEPNHDQGEHMIIQNIIGGRQDGDGAGNLDFAGPRSVAVNPLTQDILVADTGHDRVVILDQAGEYLRQFRTGSAPSVVRVDNFGRIFVVTAGAGQQGTGGGLEIYDSFGNTPLFGSIEGKVSDSRNGAPISLAVVRVNYPTSYGVPNPNPNNPTPNPFLSQQAVTDNTGYFRFNQVVLADQLGLTSTRAGFLDSTVSVDVVPAETTTVDVVMIPENSSTPGFGAVTGTLLSAHRNEPLPNFNVGIHGTGISDRTNNSGQFLVLGIPTGTVTLDISANGTIFKSIPNVSIVDGQTKDLGVILIDI